MSTSHDDPDHPDNWREFADERQPDLIRAPDVWGAYFALGEPPPWPLRVEFIFADPASAIPALMTAPKQDVQYVVRLYTGGRKVGTGLLWWEPIGTPLADADGGREPPAEALACGIDQEHAHTAEELRAADVQATFDRITDTLRRSGLLPPESGHEQQGQTPKPTPYTGPSLCD